MSTVKSAWHHERGEDINADHTPTSGPGRDPAADPLAEARDLIERLLEDRITPAEAARFEALALGSRDVRRLYLRTMNLVSNLPHHVAAHEWILGDEPDENRKAAETPMGEAMVLPALRDEDLAGEEPAPLRLPTERPARPAAAPAFPAWRLITAAAAVAVAGVVTWGVLHEPARHNVAVRVAPATQAVPDFVVVPTPPPPEPVRLTATAGATWAGNAAIPPGTALEPGRRVALGPGAVEVVFSTGTRVVVEGPAAFEVVDGNHAALEYGKLVARVPPAGHGFGVRFGDRLVTDLGTEFGLATDPQHHATVSVFDGQVVLERSTAAATTPGTQPATRPDAPLHLTQGQTVAAADAGPGWTPAEPTDVHFARTLADVRTPLPSLPSTAVGLKDGQRDPNWLLWKASAGEAAAKPAAMTTTGPPSPTFWAANDPARSQWLCTDGNLPGVLPGDWIFRTTIDLTGFDPATAEVRVDVMADDALNDVRINGKTAGVSVPLATDRQNWRQFHRLTLRGFSAGRNTVDFVIYNGEPAPGLKTSKMGFRAEFHGDATPVTVR